MHDMRPRPDEYRNVCNALLQAFAEMYAEPRRARRAFAAALEARGRVAALLTLRTVPERFGALLPDVEPRVRDFADEAAESYALCREHCTRPLVRDGARLLRVVHAARARERRLKAARTRAYIAASELDDAKQLHRAAEETRARMWERAQRTYVQPKRAVEAVMRVLRERGRDELDRVFDLRWKPAGRLRWRYRKGWRGWLGAIEMDEALEEFPWFRVEVWRLHELSKRLPGAERMARLEAARDAADAEVAAIEAERSPVPDPDRTLRQAAQVFYDAMRLLERRPSDAVPHLSRQLAPMLPEEAEALIAEVLRLAARYDTDNDRRRGRGRDLGDDWRDGRSSYGR
jgi:hypothetical protein